MKKPMTWDRGGTSGTPPIGCNAWGKGGGDRREVDPGDSPQGIRGGIRIGTAPALCDGALPLAGSGVDDVGGADGGGRPVRPGSADAAGDPAPGGPARGVRRARGGGGS